MRYFKIYDWIAPEGQAYRELEDGSLEVDYGKGQWEASIFEDLNDLKSTMSKGDRLEEVEEI